MNRPPHWLAETANRVIGQFHSADYLAPIGCHYFFDKEHAVWEITLFVSHTETVGGELDGQLTESRFAVDLSGLETIFSKVHRFAWQAVSMGEDDDLGPHLAIEGECAGHEVWLRIVSSPPKQFEAGRIADVYEMRFFDRW